MTSSIARLWATAALAVALVMAIVEIVATPRVIAQEATPGPGFDPTARYPVHVHVGNCAEPRNIAFSLGEGGYGLPVLTDRPATPDETAMHVGPETANPAIVAVAEVEAPLDQLTADDRVIDAHVAGGDADANRFVCGVVGGFRVGDDLMFGLEEANASGYGGTAWLHDNGDGTTRVTLFLASQLIDGVDPARVTPQAARETVLAEDLPATTQVEGIVVRDGGIADPELTLLEGIPTILHVVNTDDEDYRFRIRELVEAAPLPANEVIVLEFTAPSGGVHAGQLLAADDDEELAILPITVVPR